MTITEIRPTVPRQTQSTPESQHLAELQAAYAVAVNQLGQLNAAADDAHGWGDHIEAERVALDARMEALRVGIRDARTELVELTVTTVLAARPWPAPN